MALMFLLLVISGLALGSFVNALVWRVHMQAPNRKQQAKTTKQSPAKNKQYSILTGKSQCVHCGHSLGVEDLIPLLSWLLLRGHCRYCKKPISVQYPLVEVSLALVFALSYWLWPGEITETGDWLLFISWLGVATGLMALAVYDLRWMLLPNRILYPTLMVAVIGRLGYIVLAEQNTATALIGWLLSLAVASGLFWLIFTFSKGRLIGYGDVRLGLVLGTVLAQPALSFLMIFLASLLGTIFVVPSLIKRQRGMAATVPFGPFLILATWLCLLFGQELVNWYSEAILP